MEMTTLTHCRRLFLAFARRPSARTRRRAEVHGRRGAHQSHHRREPRRNIVRLRHGSHRLHHACAVRNILTSLRSLSEPTRSRAHDEPHCSGAAAALLGVALIMAGGAASEWLSPLLTVFIAWFAIAWCAVIWLLFPMSEARDVALERIDDHLRARRHGAAHRNRRIQLPWGWWFVRLKTKKIFNR